MALNYKQFLEEIERYKTVNGLVRNDDEYRKKLWLIYLPFDYEQHRLKTRRQNWKPEKHIEKHISTTKGAGKRLPKSLLDDEEPTLCMHNGCILGIGEAIPLFINRGPPTASEFQGARIRAENPVGPYYPRYMSKKTANYLSRKYSLRHGSCIEIKKDPATLWRDMMNSKLDNEILSSIHCYYHPLIASAKERFESRWPHQRRLEQTDQYFKEYLQLFNTPSNLFIQNWVDEQLAFPHVDHSKTSTNQNTKRNISF